MKKKNIRKIYEAVGLQLIFLLIIGTMMQSGIAAEISTDNEIFDNNKFEPIPKSGENKYRVWGKGQLNYIFPKNLKNFDGEYWEDENEKFIDGYIENTDIIVTNSIVRFFWGIWGIKPKWATLNFLKFEPFRFYFRQILPKYLEIKNYTGNIYCKFTSVPRGPAWTVYSISGEADDIKAHYGN